MRIPSDEKQLSVLLRQGEGAALEFKRTTGELKEGMQTICAFLNGVGGIVLFGVRPDGRAEGQDVSDQTLRDVAQATERFEPPVQLGLQRIKLKLGREVLAVSVERAEDSGPFTYEGRPYERVGSATRRMAQAKYEKALLERAHGRRRWENAPAEDVEPRDLDRDEIFRIVEAARSTGRLVGPIGRSVPDILDRLGVRKGGKVLQAAVVLFGRDFLPDYPQCEIRMARFRGKDKTEFLDQRGVRGPAFKLLEEAELFCQRHFPLPGKIVPGKLQRQDKPLIPPDAMREILVNALIHRDYSMVGGAIQMAVFDDRVEVWSAGAYPTGVTPESLTRQHLSVLRNPIIAEVFHRTGLIERWGRGTNRVIEMCRKAGIPAPAFEEVGPAALVTFRVPVGSTAQVAPQVAPQVTPQVAGVLEAARTPASAADLQRASGLKDRVHFLRAYLQPCLETGWLQRTIPDKPRSRMQRYRITPAGAAALKKGGRGAP